MRTFSGVMIVMMVVAFSFSGKTRAQDLQQAQQSTTTSTLQPQQVQDKPEVFEKIHIAKKKPIPYVTTREADVMWAKVIWRMVDLREKMNLPLYYPLKPIGERMNLMNLILYGVENEGLQVYNPDLPYEFTAPLTREELEQRLGNVTHTTQVTDVSGMARDTTVEGERAMDQVKKLLVKEKWFFDKHYSTLQVRVIGLCPIRVFAKEVKGVATEDEGAQEMTMKMVCWIYYPEARNLLSCHPVFTRHTDAQQISYDDLFTQRRFSGYIYKESNVYENRRVQDYTTGIEALVEADRIKASMVDLEHDLWEY
jgi:gliding motility associated protien GldN